MNSSYGDSLIVGFILPFFFFSFFFALPPDQGQRDGDDGDRTRRTRAKPLTRRQATAKPNPTRALGTELCVVCCILHARCVYSSVQKSCLWESRLSSLRRELGRGNEKKHCCSTFLFAWFADNLSISFFLGFARIQPVSLFPTMAVLPAEIESVNDSIKLFGRWDAQDVEVKDISLTDYIQVSSPLPAPSPLTNFLC
jgi:hypothetical protein